MTTVLFVDPTRELKIQARGEKENALCMGEKFRLQGTIFVLLRERVHKYFLRVNISFSFKFYVFAKTSAALEGHAN